MIKYVSKEQVCIVHCYEIICDYCRQIIATDIRNEADLTEDSWILPEGKFTCDIQYMDESKIFIQRHLCKKCYIKLLDFLQK